jgi:hypothetical protein
MAGRSTQVELRFLFRELITPLDCALRGGDLLSILFDHC